MLPLPAAVLLLQHDGQPAPRQPSWGSGERCRLHQEGRTRRVWSTLALSLMLTTCCGLKSADSLVLVSSALAWASACSQAGGEAGASGRSAAGGSGSGSAKRGRWRHDDQVKGGARPLRAWCMPPSDPRPPAGQPSSGGQGGWHWRVFRASRRASMVGILPSRRCRWSRRSPGVRWGCAGSGCREPWGAGGGWSAMGVCCCPAC